MIRVVLFLMVSLIYESSFSQSSFLLDLMEQSGKFELILNSPSQYKIQIIYTQINRNRNNVPSFRSFFYQYDSSRYFYPASTVKLPTVLMALERVNEIGKFDKNSPLIIDSLTNISKGLFLDSSAENNKPTIAHFAKKILLVSDNEAYNRLYEFLGQDNLNLGLIEKGYQNIRICHKLGVDLNPKENAIQNAFTFYNSQDRILFFQKSDTSKGSYLGKIPIKMGIGYLKNDTLFNEPFNFTNKNCFNLKDQQEILKSILFFKYIPPENRFNLSKSDNRFLFQYLSEMPKESEYPKYDSNEYFDNYGKFFMFGNTPNNIPENIRIFNKIGQAYGFLIDNAYIVDFDKKVEFLLSAVIYCNKDEIFNDDIYEYEEVGFPFFENLGNLIYQYELTRERPFVPNLKKFRVKYN